MSPDTTQVPITMLGQSGVRLTFGDTNVYIDPYLTDRVAEEFGSEFERQVPAPFRPEKVDDANWVLITHDHADHLDISTLLPLALASPSARFIMPRSASEKAIAAGLDSRRVVEAAESPIFLTPTLSARAIPAAHPTVIPSGNSWEAVGFLLDWRGRRIYHSGDTSADSQLIDTLAPLGPIDVAFLPVNERNFFRERAGIIGNMSVREAFQFAEEIHALAVVPIHWDLFKPNSVSPREILLTYELLKPAFELLISPTEL